MTAYEIENNTKTVLLIKLAQDKMLSKAIKQ